MTSSSFRRLDAKGTKKKSAVLSSHATANRNDENLESGKQVALSVSLPDQKKKTTPFPFLCCGDNAHATQGSLYNTYVHGCRIAVQYATQRNERPRHARSKPVSLVLPSTDKSYTKTCAFSSHRILQNLARCFHVINEKNVSCIPCTSSHTHTKKLDRR
jgi:hypothetical protein